MGGKYGFNNWLKNIGEILGGQIYWKKMGKQLKWTNCVEKVYKVQSTVYSIHSSMESVACTVYSVQ